MSRDLDCSPRRSPVTSAEAVSLLRSKGVDVRFMGGADSMIMCRYRYPGTTEVIGFAICRSPGVCVFSHMGPGQLMTEKPTPTWWEPWGWRWTTAGACGHT